MTGIERACPCLAGVSTCNARRVPILEQTPDGLNFKRGTLDKVHKLVFDEMFANGKTEKGEFARDAYRRKWEAFKKLNP